MKPFIPKPEKQKKIVVSVRLEQELAAVYDQLAGRYHCSRNALICMALRYALENIDENVDES